MTREQRIIETFVELADTIVDEFDVVEFLHRVVERCVILLDCEEAGILLADAAGALRVMASSSERTEALELMQIQNDEGPCFESFHRGAPVSSEDLSDERRWPRFSAEAIDRGFRSAHAMPMRVQGDTVGALNLFNAEPGVLEDRDRQLGQGLADIAAVALTQERAVREAHGVVHQLQGALNSRVTIEQAKGILAERASVSVDEAFARLRDYARSGNRRLGDVARDLIEGEIDPASLARAVSPADPAF